jgi:TIR domain
MAHDVFISYSSHDKSIADAVCAGLEAAKIRCWIAPRDMLPGVPYGEALGEALRESQILLLIFSSKSNHSGQVMREVESAVDKGIPILPFRVEDVKPSASLDYFVKAIHWLDAITPPLENHLQSLVGTVQSLLTRQHAGVVVAGLRGTVDSAGKPANPTPAFSAAEPAKILRKFASGYLIAGVGLTLAIVLLLALAPWWPHSNNKGEIPSSNSSPTSTSPPVSEPLRVQKIDVHLYARQGNEAESRGLIGHTAFAAQLRDQVTVQARLSRPAYAYLIAFRPDGKTELCYPDREDIPPPMTDRPHYPSDGSGVRYGLSDGSGLMVFAVVASEQPLPSYQQWLQGRSLAWRSESGQPREEVLWSSGKDVDILLPADKLSSPRGKGEAALPLAPAFKKLAESLQVDSSKNAVGLLGFTVEQP